MSKFKKGLVILLILIFVFALFLLISGLKNSPRKQPANTGPIPVPSDFNVDYSHLNKLIPGKSTREDVEKINGLPSSASTFGNNTILYYPTPSSQYKNTVAIENGKVKYAIENVFGEYRRTYESYVKAYGQPDLHLYNSNGDYFEWFIFLRFGVGVENSAGGITRILYFVPQSKDDFMNGLAKDVGLSLDPPTQSPNAY